MWEVSMHLYVASNKGTVRAQNEDCACIIGDEYYDYSRNEIAKDKRKYLLAVADGMGGHQAGEIASSMAISILLNDFLHNLIIMDYNHILSGMNDIIKKISMEIVKKSERDSKLSGMGTTLTAAIICENKKIIISHIGDSRMYLMRKNAIIQLTDDHTYVNDLFKAGNITYEQVKSHPQRNILTKAIGGFGNAEADVFSVDVTDGDYLLLCTDGLTGILEDDIIKSVIVNNENIQLACTNLIRMANDGGGFDNITVAIAKI